LVTYSKADMLRFPSREMFGQLVESAFNVGKGKVRVEYWACCLEQHEHTSGQHYHVSVKLSGHKRWNPVRIHLLENHGINVNFSESNASYYTAYKYVCKWDTDVFTSENHPHLKEIGSPKTKKCMHAYIENSQKRRSANVSNATTEGACSTPKTKRLSCVDVSDFIVKHNVKTETELFAQASLQKEAGKKDLANFVMSRSSKALQDVIGNTWEMQGVASDSDSQLVDIEQFCCKKDDNVPLRIDTTFNVCELWLTDTFYRNKRIVLESSGNSPVFFGHPCFT